MSELQDDLLDLKKIYPEVVKIVDSWQQFCMIHGIKLSDEEDEILANYVKILKKLGVL